MKLFSRFLILFTLCLLLTSWSATPVEANGRVVVYSSNQQAQNDMMAEAFEKATGVKCEMVRAGTGVLVKKMIAEKGRPLGMWPWAWARAF